MNEIKPFIIEFNSVNAMVIKNTDYANLAVGMPFLVVNIAKLLEKNGLPTESFFENLNKTIKKYLAITNESGQNVIIIEEKKG